MPIRTLVLKKESLTELTPGQLGSVVGAADAVATGSCSCQPSCQSCGGTCDSCGLTCTIVVHSLDGCGVTWLCG